MYHHSLLFVIVSDNGRIEETLQGIQPVEDCDYAFRTISFMEEDAVNFRRTDTAFLYDCVGGAGLPEGLDQLEDLEELILVAGAGDALLTDRPAVSAANELWIMPGGGRYDDGLLKIYFERLAKRMKQRADARKQGICFDTLINSVPDIAWFKDISGAHLIVNDSFCEMVGKTKEQIYRKGHCYIWDASKEDEEVCLRSDQIIMDSRTTSTFEESVKTRKDMRLLKSYKSALVDTDGNIFGTCGLAHDVTELRNMDTELDIVLNNVPFAVIVEDMQGIVLNKNIRFDMYFPQFADIEGKSSEEWRSSLNKKLLSDCVIMEITVQLGGEERVLVFEETPILDVFEREIGKIVTLTDITLERNISKQNERTANTDYLTGLGNRRYLMHYLENLESVDDIVLVMVDLDNFKHVNDTYGHEAGDRALEKTADILRECFENEIIARVGGDEFMVVTSGKKAQEVTSETQRLLGRMRNAYKTQKEFSGITVSAGVVPSAEIPKEKRNVSHLLQTADALLYEAKKNGKNCYCVYGE